MDPQVTLDYLFDAIENRDWIDTEDYAEALRDWLENGGFTPELSPARLRQVLIGYTKYTYLRASTMLEQSPENKG